MAPPQADESRQPLLAGEAQQGKQLQPLPQKRSTLLTVCPYILGESQRWDGQGAALPRVHQAAGHMRRTTCRRAGCLGPPARCHAVAQRRRATRHSYGLGANEKSAQGGQLVAAWWPQRMGGSLRSPPAQPPSCWRAPSRGRPV